MHHVTVRPVDAGRWTPWSRPALVGCFDDDDPADTLHAASWGAGGQVVLAFGDPVEHVEIPASGAVVVTRGC